MLKNHAKFNSINGRRLVLIVDDEQINREMLGYIVSSDFDALYARDGEEALRLMRENVNFLSLVLLDLLMPGVDGFAVMREMKADEALSHLPIIVLTSEHTAEVECLRLGASDFILKPFSQPEVIIARMQRIIELHEDRYIIQSTEREDMTGLFNREFFFRYAEQYDRFHPDQEMDAVALDVNRFHLINEMFGRAAGDNVLIHLATYLKELRERTGCMVSRVEGDRFFVYVPHGGMDYTELAQQVNRHLGSLRDISVRVRCGVYRNADKGVEIERRFDRALQAANTIKDNYAQLVAYYDASIHERKIYEDRLISEMDEALATGQFEVYYQPKYNVEGELPALSSAEALVRWHHPTLGMVSPGVFIPLFEKNGMIQKLDYYIWARVAEQLGDWRRRYGREVRVSVNVSRIDLYNQNLIEYLDGILTENGIDPGQIYLEITESAYTENPEQIGEMVERLRDRGFKIEMDDFGTGYSSLNMLADVPVDVLKMDMRFVRNLHSNEKQETLVKLVMDIAKYLSLTVVAEGVEDKGQADFLKSVGCSVIQGYYFSRPLPGTDFIRLVTGATQ